MPTARKSDPFSIRLSREVDELVRAEAKRSGRSRGAVIEALTEESLRVRLFPGIVFTGPEWSRRASIAGKRWDVWQIVDAVRDFGDPASLAAEFSLSERQIALALAYAKRFPEEIEAQVAENNRPIAELERDFPFADFVTIE